MAAWPPSRCHNRLDKPVTPSETSSTYTDNAIAPTFSLDMPAWAAIRAEMVDEYLQPHDHPWIIGFSGGKDSTLVAHLTFEMLMSLPPSQRRRHVHIVSNDTLVESPLVIIHLKRVLAQIEEGAHVFGLPITCKLTRPDADDTFWVNLIGRGYPAPNRSFRWCTDRMKI